MDVYVSWRVSHFRTGLITVLVLVGWMLLHGRSLLRDGSPQFLTRAVLDDMALICFSCHRLVNAAMVH